METFNTSNFLSKNYNNQLIFFNNNNLSHPQPYPLRFGQPSAAHI